jgi:hypothetical protein
MISLAPDPPLLSPVGSREATREKLRQPIEELRLGEAEPARCFLGWHVIPGATRKRMRFRAQGKSRMSLKYSMAAPPLTLGTPMRPWLSAVLEDDAEAPRCRLHAATST